MKPVKDLRKGSRKDLTKEELQGRIAILNRRVQELAEEHLETATMLMDLKIELLHR